MAGRVGPTKPDPDREWLTVPEACWVLQKCTSWLYKRLKPDHPQYIESKLVGRSRMFSRAALNAWIERQTAVREEAAEAA